MSWKQAVLATAPFLGAFIGELVSARVQRRCFSLTNVVVTVAFVVVVAALTRVVFFVVASGFLGPGS